MTIDLVPVDYSHRDAIREWRNRPEVARFMKETDPISEADHARWFDAMMVDPRSHYWIVTVDGAPSGIAHLSSISEKDRRCDWGYYLASNSARGAGVGSYVWYRLLDYAFGVLDLEKVCAEVLGFNDRVLAMHATFGFTREGLLRHHVRRPDGVYDIVLFGLLREEWEQRREHIEAKLRKKGRLPYGQSLS